MGWSNNSELQGSKNRMDTSSKILLAIIACVMLIIILIIVLIIGVKQSTYIITVDGKTITTTSKEKLIYTIDNITYINIEEFAKIVGYEYHHKGEYKGFTIDEKKCYVQGEEETASFFLNDSKVYKLPVNKLEQDYKMFETGKAVKQIDEKMYAPLNAINIAFNVNLTEDKNSITINTLNYLVKVYDSQLKKRGYTGISDLSFEDKKAVLYGYFIVKKENGLYKIIDKDGKEIVSDKYNSIEFSENTKEFFVTNSLKQVGIINLDGTTKIEPVYDSIEVLDKESDLYLIKKDNKYGIAKSDNSIIAYPEYDKIGIEVEQYENVKNKYLILNTLIPVCKNEKWGALDKTGKIICNIEYDSFGCNLEVVELNGVKKECIPVLAIEECNGVVVKKEEKYGLIDLKGELLVPIKVESIYELENIESEEKEYFMIYNNKELNILERLELVNNEKTNESNNETKK